jgi:hypothetical protein
VNTPRLLALATFAAALPTLGEPLFSNGSANPAVPALGASSMSQSGVPAPGGASWSEAASAGGEANAVGGFSSHGPGASGQYRFADDFTVTGTGWSLSTLTLYAYQVGASGPASPFSGVNVRVWNAPPWQPGAAVVFGDTATNRMTGSTLANVYRIFNSQVTPLPTAPDTTRPIWATTVSLAGLTLPPGTYWLDWQYTTVNPDAGAYSPPVTAAGNRSPGSANARQYRAAYGNLAGGWTALLDSGKPAAAADLPQDLPFLLAGTPAPACDPDYNLDGNADQDDVAYLVNVIAGAPNPAGTDPDFNRDGNADQDDVMALVNVIAGGSCP